MSYPPGTICIVSGELSRYWQFAAALARTNKPEGTVMAWARSCNVAENLNQCLRSMRGEWAWFMGDDHAWEPDILFRLLDRNVDVVAPVCLKRKPPFTPIVYDRMNYPGNYNRIDICDLPTTGLIEVPAGCVAGMLVRRRVIEAIPDPWFRVGQYDPAKLNEDFWFCKAVTDAGFTIHTDCEVRLDHLTSTVIRPVVRDGRWQIELDLDGAVTHLDIAQDIADIKRRRRAEQGNGDQGQPGGGPVPAARVSEH